MELLLIAGGGGGASSHATNETSDMDAQGLLSPWTDYKNSIKIPGHTDDAGILYFQMIQRKQYPKILNPLNINQS